MATNDYIISFTDPTNGSITVKQKTTNGAVLPTVSEPFVTYAVGADTSIVLHGRGVPNYGDNLQEAVVHILENFSGASQPAQPIEGQLWYAVYRYWFDATINRWYVWDNINAKWLIVRENGSPIISGTGYDYSASVIFSQPTQPTTSITSGNYWFNTTTNRMYLYHKLSDVEQPFWIECIYKFDDVAPSSPQPTDTPERYLRVFTGSEWSNVNSVRASTKEPQNPEAGMIWVDTNVTGAGVPQMYVWDHIHSQWVNVGTTLLLTGGTFVQPVVFSNGAQVTTSPTVGEDIVNSTHLESRLATTSANLTSYVDNKWTTGLSTDLNANNFTVTGLRNPAGLTEAVPYGFADGRYVRNNQPSVSFQSVTVTTQLDMNSNRIINVPLTPSADNDAVCKKYVEDRLDQITTGGLTLNATAIANNSNSYLTSTNVADVIDAIFAETSTLTTNYTSLDLTVNTLTTSTIPTIQNDITGLDGRVTVIESSTTASLPLAGGSMDLGATIILQLTTGEITDPQHAVHKQYVSDTIAPISVLLGTHTSDISALQSSVINLSNQQTTMQSTLDTITGTTLPGLTAAISALQEDVIDSAEMNVTTGVITLTKHDLSTITVTNSGYPASVNITYAPVVNSIVGKTAATQPTNVDSGIDTLERVVDRQTAVKRLFVSLTPLTVTGYTTNTIQVAGDHTAKFFAGANIEIAGSTNNNGTYAVLSSSYGAGNTTINITVSTLVAAPIDGTVVAKSLKTPVYVAGDNRVVVFKSGLKLVGDIPGMYKQTLNTTSRDPSTGYAAQIYASTVTVDGTNHTVTIDNSANAFTTINQLVSSLNTQLNGFAYASYNSEDKHLIVASDTHGGMSAVTVSQGANGIFNNLANVTTTETLSTFVEDYTERGSYRKPTAGQTIIDLVVAPTATTKFEVYALGDTTQF